MSYFGRCKTSKRLEMVFLMLSGIVIVYTLRVNMSVAAQKMRDELNWSEAQKGFVLSAFYWGYAAGQLPASWLAQKYGAKWIFGFSVLIPSVLTILVPMACRLSFELALFTRMAIGFFESATFPCVFHFFPIWIPQDEKNKLIPLTVSGMYIGNIIGFSCSGYLVNSSIIVNGYQLGNWPAVFYFFGLLGVFWFPFWIALAYERPQDHPGISQEELYIFEKAFKDDDVEKKHIDAVEEPLLSAQDQEAENSTDHSDQSYSYSTGSMTNSQQVNLRHVVSSEDHLKDVDDYVKHSSSKHTEHEQLLPKLKSSNDNTYTEINPNRVRRISANKLRTFSSDSIQYDPDFGKRTNLAVRIPWGAFFSNPVSLTLFFNHWTYGWTGFLLLSEMPSYLTDVLGFDLESAGVLCIFPYIALFLCTLGFGYAFDYLQQQKNWKVRSIRMTAETIALAGSSLFLIICGFVDNKYAAYGFLILAQGMNGSVQCGIGCAYTDVAPNFSSSLNTIGNTLGAVAGIVGPLVVAFLTEELPFLWGWKLTFFLTGLMSTVALILWSVFMTAEIIPILNTPLPKRF